MVEIKRPRIKASRPLISEGALIRDLPFGNVKAVIVREHRGSNFKRGLSRAKRLSEVPLSRHFLAAIDRQELRPFREVSRNLHELTLKGVEEIRELYGNEVAASAKNAVSIRRP